MSSSTRLSESLNSADHNIDILSAMSDRKLVEKLEVIDLQTELAIKQNKPDVLRLLEVWRAQVIAARIYKAENSIRDEASEIEVVAAQVESFIAEADNRAEILLEEEKPEGVRKESTDDGTTQLSMFE